MMNDDFPISVKVRMWAFMAVPHIGSTPERLYHADMVAAFLMDDGDCEVMPDIAKEDVN